MKVIKSEHMGFCYGVKRAMNLALQAGKSHPNVGVLGELIHNKQALDYLAQNGISTVVDPVSENIKTVIFRSHGETPENYEWMSAHGIEIIDATCPDVLKVQKTAKRMFEEGRKVIIVGEKTHPEVVAILAWAGKGAIVIETEEEAERLDKSMCLGIVAQTTFIGEKLQKILAVLEEKGENCEIVITTCNATALRQQSAKQLSGKVDVMLVVGGKKSANTRHLWEICKEVCNRSYHIEVAAELQCEWFENVETVGITAGASTPEWIIEEVYKAMQELSANKDVCVSDDENMTMEELLSMDEKNKLAQKEAECSAWVKLAQAHADREELTVQITDVTKGGLLAELFGIRCFMPASQVDIRFVENLTHYIGQKVVACVIECDLQKQKVILSRKVVLHDKKIKIEKELLDSLTVGMQVKGKVKRFVDFGVFVDLGGIDALIPSKDITWEKNIKPESVLKLGEEVVCLITRVDKQSKKVALSLKALQEDPWCSMADGIEEGQILTGKVVKMLKFGAFVALVDGRLEGLVPLKEICDKRIAHPDEVLNLGDEVKVKVTSIDKEGKKISLSINQVKVDKEKAEFTEYIENNQESGALKESIGDKFVELFEQLRKA